MYNCLVQTVNFASLRSFKQTICDVDFSKFMKHSRRTVNYLSESAIHAILHDEDCELFVRIRVSVYNYVNLALVNILCLSYLWAFVSF